MPSVIRAAKIGDAAIIKSIIKILNKEGIKVISSIFFNPELSLKKGNYSKLKPNKLDLVSIKKGKVLVVQKCDGDWCKIKSKNFKGWIKANNIWGTIN